MPGPLVDIYVLAKSRSAKVAEEFLDFFIPKRKPAFHDDDPSEVLGFEGVKDISKLFELLEKNENKEYSFYWRNIEEIEPYCAIVSYCSDGSLILGLSPVTDEEWDEALTYLDKLKLFCGVEHGFRAMEYPPPASKKEYFEACKTMGNNVI